MAKKKAAAKKKMTKTEIQNALAEATGLTKADINNVLTELGSLIQKNIGKRGVGEFTLPGLLKIVRVTKKAQPAIKNWTNPFTGELQDKPAKPASTGVKVRPMKGLKDMV